jgi:hypothetical protein
MTLAEFDHGYWYALELKDFAKRIGILSAGKLRKDELEAAIRTFLRTGKKAGAPQRSFAVSGVKDVERGLSPRLRVVRYTNDPETKDFIEREALKLAPRMKRKSGARYRLNRWREQQVTGGVKLTYRALVAHYVRLCQSEEPFAKIPPGRYINFLSDYLAARGGDRRQEAIRAWHTLKQLDAPKTYRGWVRAQSAKSSGEH